MYRKSKLEVDFLTKRYTEACEELGKYRNEKNRLEAMYGNLSSLVFNDMIHKILALFTIKDESYIVYIYNFIHKGDCYFEMDFIMKRMSSPIFEKTAYANIEIKNNRLEIVNIDACVFRCGFGGKLFDYIEQYARSNDILSIRGKIYEGTPIGLDNLIRFYQKHGCEIYKNKVGPAFKKQLNTAKES